MMKVDLVKLINEVSKHPEIYNPDHKDFANQEIRNYIFNTIIKKEMNSLKGENLEDKWDQILNKYANFIRKLSNDDSSERVLERFMKWPLTKPMRIFKPYVRKQFKIPVFQSAAQLLPEMDTDVMPRIPVSAMHPISTVGGNGAIPDAGPGLRGLTPATPRPAEPRLTHPVPEPSLEVEPLSFMGIIERMPYSTSRGFIGPAELLQNLDRNRPSSSRQPSSSPAAGSADEDGDYEFLRGDRMTAAMFRGVQSFAKHLRANHEDYIMEDEDNEDEDDDDEDDGDDDDDDDDDDNDEVDDDDDEVDDDDDEVDDEENEADDGENKADDEIATEDEAMVTADDAGPSSAKKRRWTERSCHGPDSGEYVLPDLPQPKAAVDRGRSDFTAQEHIFLGWAKTMSTFTAQRQADIKTRINKIMSEAEFEDLDDEFFAGCSI